MKGGTGMDNILMMTAALVIVLFAGSLVWYHNDFIQHIDF